MPRTPSRIVVLLALTAFVLVGCAQAPPVEDGAERRAPAEPSPADPPETAADSPEDAADPPEVAADPPEDAADSAAFSRRGGNKIRICHRTNSATNPYRMIEVSVHAVAGHTRHAEDVIPPFAGFPGQNWPSSIIDENCEPIEPPTETTEPPTETTEPPT